MLSAAAYSWASIEDQAGALEDAMAAMAGCLWGSRCSGERARRLLMITQ